MIGTEIYFVNLPGTDDCIIMKPYKYEIFTKSIEEQIRNGLLQPGIVCRPSEKLKKGIN